jgi:hypothetical protein
MKEEINPNYDWQAEFRQHIVRPNRSLDRGGLFTLITGGCVILKGSDITYDEVAAQNIDVIEIFILRSAPLGNNFTITGRNAKNYYIDYFQWHCRAIKDFHGIPHTYRKNLITESYERVYAYLEDKYAEQPRPFIRKRNAAEKLHIFIDNHYCVFIPLVVAVIWSALYLLTKSGIVTPAQTSTAFVIAHAIGLIVLIAVPVVTCLLAKIASLETKKR